MATTLTVFLGVWPWVYLLQVGASDERDRRVVWSSYGPGLDVLAPGVDIWTTFMTYPSGACGLLAFSRQGNSGLADLTFDNYYAGPSDPNPAPAPSMTRASTRLG